MIKINGKLIDFKKFPNHETKLDEKQILDAAVWQKENIFGANIDFKYEDDSDLIKLMMLKKFLDSQNINSCLRIWYMPYSRMDRSENNSAFTLKYIADFINSLNFPDVEIIEPHSDVCMALINNGHARYITVDMLPEVKKAIGFREDFDFIFFPDAGAQKRYGSKIKSKWELVGFKHRDFETGKITKLEVVGDLSETLNARKVLIVDDLCSKGGTFMLAAEELKNRGAKEIYLLVGHCENTIHENVLCTDLIQGVIPRTASYQMTIMID